MPSQHARAALRRAARNRPSPSLPRSWRSRVMAVGLLLGLAGLPLGAPTAEASGGDYLLIPRERLLSLPTQGDAWRYMYSIAGSAWMAPDLDDQENKANTQALAAALVYARTGDLAMQAKARNAIAAMIPTYNLSMDTGLGPARQIAGWVMTADLIELDGAVDLAFRDLLRRALTKPIGSHSRWGGSLRICHEDSDNNWGAWCGASRIAAARYLGDSAELAQAERVHRGFLGDRTAWAQFRGQGQSNSVLSSDIRTWACDASSTGYVPTNGNCGDRSGAFPADASRNGAYSVLHAAYQSETTAGLVLQAELLHQAGYTSAWRSGALARVAAFDYKHGAWNLGTVQYHWPWLVNKRLGTAYPTVAARYGRSLGYTDWLYGGSSGGDPGPAPTATPRPTPSATPKPSPTPTPTSGPTDEPTPAPATGAPNATEEPTRVPPGRGRGHGQKSKETSVPGPSINVEDADDDDTPAPGSTSTSVPLTPLGPVSSSAPTSPDAGGAAPDEGETDGSTITRERDGPATGSTGSGRGEAQADGKGQPTILGEAVGATILPQVGLLLLLAIIGVLALGGWRRRRDRG